MTAQAEFVRLIVMWKVLVLSASAGLFACGDSASDADKKSEGSLPSCAESCPGVLAVKCSRGPVDQADCESGCEVIRASACVPQYEAMLECGGAKPSYACDDTGQVVLSRCDDESAALYSCLAKR
jgi:hypothetical protein